MLEADTAVLEPKMAVLDAATAVLEPKMAVLLAQLMLVVLVPYT